MDPFEGVASPVMQAQGSDPFAGVASPVAQPDGPRLQAASAQADQAVAKGADIGSALRIGTNYLAGSVNDAVKRGVQGVSDVIPQSVKDVYSQTPMGVMSDAGSAIIAPLANAASEQYNKFSQNHPETSGYLNAAGNTLQAASTLAGAPSVVGKVADAVGEIPLVAKLGEEGGGIPVPQPATEGASPAVLKAASAAKYQEMRDAGATLNSNGLNVVNDSVDNALKNSGLMNQKMHGGTLSVINDLKNDAASGSMDLEKIDQYRQLLGDVVSDNTSKIDGANSDAMKANVAINALDDAVGSLNQSHLSSGTPEAVDALNQARDLYSAKSRLSTLQRIQDNASMTDNPATAIKNGYKTLAKQVNINPRRWTPEEVDAINKAARTGIVTGALKIGGNRLISGIVGGVGGAAGGGVKGALLGASAAEAAAYPLRAAATALQARRANAAMDLVANRPEVQSAIPPSIAQIMQMSPKDAQIALQQLKATP